MSFESLWPALEPVGRHPRTGGYRRYAWTAEDATLREWFAAEASERGLDVTLDRAGNQWAWWGDPDAASGVVTGSHLDSVPDGGAFDGPLRVVSAFTALDTLRSRVHAVAADRRGELRRRGGRAVRGRLRRLADHHRSTHPERARGLTDADGVSLGEAATGAGKDSGAFGPDPETLRRIAAFVELHVEQGRGLAEFDRPVAVGSSIWPHGRWRLDLAGEANHAGTTRLADRHDPMLTLAEVIIAARGRGPRVRRHRRQGAGCAERRERDPSSVTAWLDARGPREAALREVAAAVGAAGGTLAEESFTGDTAFDAALVTRLAGALDGAPVLGTGAGHDAGILATAGIPAAMLFVRNPTGVSHSPAEHAEPVDCRAGVDALTAALEELAR